MKALIYITIRKHIARFFSFFFLRILIEASSFTDKSSLSIVAKSSNPRSNKIGLPVILDSIYIYIYTTFFSLLLYKYNYIRIFINIHSNT